MRTTTTLRKLVPALAGLVLLATTPLAADVLETRDGRLLQGTYLGGTQATLRFETEDGVQVVAVEDVLALTFGAHALRVPAASSVPPPASGALPASAAATPTAPDPATASRAVVPAGMHLQIRIARPLEAGTAAVGDRFHGTLESSLMAGETPIVPPGAVVHGRVAEILPTGPAAMRIRLELDGFEFRDETVPIVTGTHRVAALPPAAPGEPRNPDEPGGERTGLPAGSLLEFRLLQPVELRLR